MIHFIIFLASFFNASEPHPLKMSVCNVQYHPEKQELQLNFRFFADDFGDHLAHIYRLKQVDLENPSPEVLRVIEDYVKNNFTLKINEVPLILIFQKSELVKADLIDLVEFKVEGVEKIQFISIENKLFFDAFLTQRNLVGLELGQEEKVILEFVPGESKKKYTLP